ncbi:hypothetical protein Tco_0610509 [Tanacetum coccineum]
MHTCYNIQSLEMNMKRIKKLNPEMYNWLKDIPPQHWARKTSLCDGIIEKSTGPLTPNATKLFNLIKRDAAQYKVIWNGGDLYDTTVASIWNMANNGLEPGIPESWVHESYWLKTWVDMYRFKFNPCNGPELWPESDTPITLTALITNLQ